MSSWVPAAGGRTALDKHNAFYYSLITDRQALSKALLGNAHMLDVAAAIVALPAKRQFFARQLAATTQLPDPVVHPCLRRLAAAGVVEPVDTADRQNYYFRCDHPFWKFVRDLDRDAT